MLILEESRCVIRILPFVTRQSMSRTEPRVFGPGQVGLATDVAGKASNGLFRPTVRKYRAQFIRRSCSGASVVISTLGWGRRATPTVTRTVRSLHAKRTIAFGGHRPPSIA